LNPSRSSLDAQGDAVGQAHIVRTGGQEPLVYAVVAEVALPGDAPGHVKGDGFVWTLIDTGPAPRAPVIVYDNDAVLSLADGLFRTGFHARRRLAVPAHVHTEGEPEFALLFLGALFQDADQLNAVGGVHFLLARHLARPATPAQLMVDVQCILFHGNPP